MVWAVYCGGLVLEPLVRQNYFERRKYLILGPLFPAPSLHWQIYLQVLLALQALGPELDLATPRSPDPAEESKTYSIYCLFSAKGHKERQEFSRDIEVHRPLFVDCCNHIDSLTVLELMSGSTRFGAFREYFNGK
jgi:hypothetical protein